MARRRAWIWLAAGVLALAAGCNSHTRDSPDEQVRRQAAEDAREVRRDAQQAGVEARKAAEEARRNAREIVAGVKQGWQEGAPPRRVDLNTASVSELSALPGLSDADAHRIVRGRPYRQPGDLVTRGLLTQDQYDRLSERVEAHGKTG